MAVINNQQKAPRFIKDYDHAPVPIGLQLVSADFD